MSVEVWKLEAEQQIAEYQELLNAGQLSESEYEELVQDVLDISKIEGALDLEENKILAQKAIDALKVIAGLI